jgi:hypothetical protein
MLTKLESLLINLEDSIFNLVKDILVSAHKRTFTIDETLLLMNVNLSINKELITKYDDHFTIHCKDIDMVNLIIKYVETCSKIVSYHHTDENGILELDYHPKYDIKSLDEAYFTEKYTKHKNHYQLDRYNLMLKIVTNILLPFTIKYCIHSYYH